MAWFRNLVSKFVTKVNGPILERLGAGNQFTAMNSVVAQLSLMMQYKNLFASGHHALKLSEVGFRVNSQHEEDGILLYIFALIGVTNKICVEICAGDGIECNTSNLIINHKWTGLLVDGNDANVDVAREFYSRHPNTMIWPPQVRKAWITKDNVNQVISDGGINGSIDLLSLDIDGVDYWLWEAMNVINPRVVVLEFNHLLGPDKAVTVPYSDSFVAEFTRYGSDYAGASLAAFVKLGRKKGYRLIGTNAFATNAFFIREDVKHPWLEEVSATSCFDHPRAKFGIEVRYPPVATKPWVEV
jgi:hypothetical protein